MLRTPNAILYFRRGEEPAAGLVVTNSMNRRKMVTDMLGRLVNAPETWLQAGARLHVLLPDGRLFDCVVEVSATDGIPLPIHVPHWREKRALPSIRQRIAQWTKILIHHWVAIMVITVAIAIAAFFVQFFGT